MRYLVKDGQNDKLIGIFALGDPVFNLRTRDDWIGWGVNQRRAMLTHVMDAYIVGALPPYNQLLGGKLVASLIGSDEVRRNFEDKYKGREGIISESVKPSNLALVAITSALGRSSIYNRLKLNDLVELRRIGFTKGYGHFQVGDEAFKLLRRALLIVNHEYANGHRFGQGPNWKIRTIRQALGVLGIDAAILRHGIKREVFAMPFCDDVQAHLRGEADYKPRTPTVSAIANAALERWVLPRSERRPEFANWDRADTTSQLLSVASQLELPLK